MERTKDYNGCLEIDFALKMSQLEGCFKFLDYMNNDKVDAPRNETERQIITTNLKRIRECREMYRTILRKHNIVRDSNDVVQIANPGCMQPTKGDQ